MRPLVRATGFKNTENVVTEVADRMFGGDRDRARQHIDEAQGEIWINDKYQVSVHRTENILLGPIMQINIRRRDGAVVFRDWREFQEIKNQLAGPECEGFEMYPAESRLVDTSNKYHIWVLLDPDKRLPVGWFEREVYDTKSNQPGMRQRPLPKHWQPTGATRKSK